MLCARDGGGLDPDGRHRVGASRRAGRRAPGPLGPLPSSLPPSHESEASRIHAGVGGGSECGGRVLPTFPPGKVPPSGLPSPPEEREKVATSCPALHSLFIRRSIFLCQQWLLLLAQSLWSSAESCLCPQRNNTGFNCVHKVPTMRRIGPTVSYLTKYPNFHTYPHTSYFSVRAPAGL